MPKRPLALQLDEVVQAILVSLQSRPEKAPHRELASLARVVLELRDLPRDGGQPCLSAPSPCNWMK